MVVGFIGRGNRSIRRKLLTCRKSLIILYHIMLHWVHLVWAGFELTTLVAIGTDWIGSYKSNYHTIMNTTALSDSDTGQYRAVWRHDFMTLNTDYNNIVNFEGLDIYYPIGLNAIMSVLIFKTAVIKYLSCVVCFLLFQHSPLKIRSKIMNHSNMMSFFRFEDKRVIYRWYNLIHRWMWLTFPLAA